jgi:hypothetical protein
VNIKSCFGDYLSADHIDGKPATVTMDVVKMVDLQDEKGQHKNRPVVYFKGTPRGWILNRTNAEALAAMFGLETTAWQGRRVTLVSAEVQFGPNKVKAVRVAGSPDLSADVTFDLKLPRKKAQRVTLTRTANGTVPAPAPIPDSTTITREVIIDTETGEAF